MATFNDATVGVAAGQTTPDFGAQRKSEPKTRKVAFGDGYEQRLTVGLNQSPKIWDLTWSAKSNTVSAAIEAFFEARGGVESFDWTPLTEATSYKFVVESWNRQFEYADICTITATFRQVFEP
jgi:phage-related protein